MTNVMMMLGDFPFMLETAAYQQLRRRSEYRWAQLDRVGQTPASQFIGKGADEITLDGEILPHWEGGFDQVKAMRAQAAKGKDLALIDGANGYVLGRWVILSIEETETEHLQDGRPHSIEFSVSLREYGGSDSSGLGSAVAALYALTRLL